MKGREYNTAVQIVHLVISDVEHYIADCWLFKPSRLNSGLHYLLQTQKNQQPIILCNQDYRCRSADHDFYFNFI